MVSGALDRMTGWMSSMLEPFSSVASSSYSQEEQWIPIDKASDGHMSMYASSQTGEMGVYYYHGTEVTSDELARCYRRLSNHSGYGPSIAGPLLAPFQDRAYIPQDAWLSQDIISRYFSSLQSSTTTTIDPGYFNNPDFISSLGSSERRRVADRLRNSNWVFWPGCRRNNHWYLMMIQRVHGNDFKIHVLDTYNDSKTHLEIAEKGKALLYQLYQGTARVVNENPTLLVPEQDNHADCGASIAYFALQKSRGEPLNGYEAYSSRKCSYVQFRLHMALTLEAQALAETIDLAGPSSPALTPMYASSTLPRVTSSQDLEARSIQKPGIRVF